MFLNPGPQEMIVVGIIALLLFASMTVGSLFLAFRSHGCMRVVALGLILFVGSLPGLITTIGVFVPLQHLQRAVDESRD